MKRSCIGHTKIKRLQQLLDLRLYEAVGLLESIWHLTARECPRGDLGRLSDEDIACWVEWRGEPARMVEGLVAARWLDRCAECRLVVHDWADHCDDGTRKAIDRKGLTPAVAVQPKCVVSGHVATSPDISRLPMPMPMPVPLPTPEPSVPPEPPRKRGEQLPDWLRSSPGYSDALWAAWMDTRRRKRATTSGTAIDLLLKKLSVRPEHAAAYIERAVERGWQGVDWAWYDQASAPAKANAQPAVSPPPETQAERHARWRREHPEEAREADAEMERIVAEAKARLAASP